MYDCTSEVNQLHKLCRVVGRWSACTAEFTVSDVSSRNLFVLQLLPRYIIPTDDDVKFNVQRHLFVALRAALNRSVIIDST